MYCYIKYADVNLNVKDDNNSIKSGTSSLKSVRSKTSIHENKTLLVNPDCYVQILLDYVASEINFDKERNFDLCDATGKLLNITEMKPWLYATEVLESQKVYYIVFFERDDNGHYKRLDPLINKNSRDYFDLMVRLKRYIPSTRRFSLERRASRRSAEELSFRLSRANLKKSAKSLLTPDRSSLSPNDSRHASKKSSLSTIKSKPSVNIKRS